MPDFWTKLLTGHTLSNTKNALDQHLAPSLVSGKAVGKDFENVRSLTDRHREAHALRLPVSAGTKVSFTGGLGAFLAYEDSPKKGMTGTVVNVRSANGDITHHEGKVFVDWEDGKFRSVHAEHLRAVGSKAASELKQQFEKIKGLAEKRPDSKFLKSLLTQMADKGFAPTEKQMAVVEKIEGEIKQQAQMKEELKGLNKGANFDASTIGEEKSGPLVNDGEDAEVMSNFSQDENRSVIEHQGKSAKSKDDPCQDGWEMMGLKKKDGKDVPNCVPEKKAKTYRVSSLGDLTPFLKRADGKLVHKSTQDLWSFSKDADGNYLVSRLFDDNGEPLKA